MDEWDSTLAYREGYLTPGDSKAGETDNVRKEEIMTTPLFSVDVAKKLDANGFSDLFPQYGLLGRMEKIHDAEILSDEAQVESEQAPDKLGHDHVFLNMNTPFSAFICGSQGSGKSHTLSCMLESALIESNLGKMARPLAAIVFYWDKTGNQPCEAAYLCSSGIPVTVLASPSNVHDMKEAYGKLPGAAKPVVRPLLFSQKHLNKQRMMKLMAADSGSTQALYMAVVREQLRQIVFDKRDGRGLDYTAFKARMDQQDFTPVQRNLLHMRLELLESFLDGLLENIGIVCYEDRMPERYKASKAHDQKKVWINEQVAKRKALPDIWSCEPGSLTIVDLTDPLVQDGESACAMFNMCLDLFLENQPEGGTMLALDEAHKYMTDGGSSKEFADSLFSAVRLQRHHGIRVVVATQEPTISPRLLDLCSMTIVHRFSSPAWLQTLKVHLAGVSTSEDQDSKRNVKELFKTIVNLEAGQALLFSTSALLDFTESGPSAGGQIPKLSKLGLRYIKIRVRQRLTADGGRSLRVVQDRSSRSQGL